MSLFDRKNRFFNIFSSSCVLVHQENFIRRSPFQKHPSTDHKSEDACEQHIRVPTRYYTMKEYHNTTSRYYPATKKDADREIKKHDFCECENEGVDTHTHTSRYVPAKGGPIFSWIFKKDRATDANIKSNWLGINIHNEQP
jgi:hypothetical protein